MTTGTKEPSLGNMTAFAREQFGLDLDLDRVAIARLAAIGLTVQAWRNTSLETSMLAITSPEGSRTRT
jgi:hypothetical protein